eukprot:1356511-Amphidinium_carterae.1
MTVRSKLPIEEGSFVKLFVGRQLLAPPAATIKDLKKLFGDWTEGAPVDLTVLVAGLKVRRHTYSIKGNIYYHVASDDVLLDPDLQLSKQVHALTEGGSTCEQRLFGGPAKMEPPNCFDAVDAPRLMRNLDSLA